MPLNMVSPARYRPASSPGGARLGSCRSGGRTMTLVRRWPGALTARGGRYRSRSIALVGAADNYEWSGNP